jgi:hypothetical protein
MNLSYDNRVVGVYPGCKASYKYGFHHEQPLMLSVRTIRTQPLPGGLGLHDLVPPFQFFLPMHCQPMICLSSALRPSIKYAWYM